MPKIRKKVRFHTKARKTKKRKWKTAWVTVDVPPAGKSGKPAKEAPKSAKA